MRNVSSGPCGNAMQIFVRTETHYNNFRQCCYVYRCINVTRSPHSTLRHTLVDSSCMTVIQATM